MNAITFLIKEHRRFRKNLAIISEQTTNYNAKKRMFADFCKDLIIHEAMEQIVWYPYFKNNKKLKSEVKHLLSEEKHADNAIKKLSNLKTKEAWEEKFLDFKNDVEHHANEEEEKLFPNVKEILEEAKLEQIGKELQKFKNSLIKESY